jgi:hypothetical protein
MLDAQGYTHASVIRYVRAAAHLGKFVQRRGACLADVDPCMLQAFRRHLPRCRCPEANGGRTGYHAGFGVKVFHSYLISCGICLVEGSTSERSVEPALVVGFRDCFQMHRGVLPPTLRLYTRGATQLVRALGEDVSEWNAQELRAFLIKRAGECGTETTQKLITALRAFLRYLGFRGETRSDLHLAIPAIAHWRLAKLPQALSAQELDRLIATCNGYAVGCLRDRAVLLLLSRLGLRAGDVGLGSNSLISIGRAAHSRCSGKDATSYDYLCLKRLGTHCCSTWNCVLGAVEPTTCFSAPMLRLSR